MTLIRVLAMGAGVLVASTAVLLFVPPLRDWFFSHKMWPFATPLDVTSEDIRTITALAQPGDVVIERNLHSWHWMLFCKASTGSNWVHMSLVERPGNLITMFKYVQEQPFSTYVEKQSTDMVLLRPPYPDESSRQRAIDFARSKLGTTFDPSFDDPAGNCAGLVAQSLEHGGVHVERRPAFGFLKPVYGATDFFNIAGAKIIWTHRPIRETTPALVRKDAGAKAIGSRTKTQL